ncbi:MarR family winged helix-turn-helix transcriptional regulator [Insolitispirillum peregrinum]|uniref:DNA-binding transcriptional regulator, MarR family n=1 Tax=Insolitispirillum peregrinum TaxID=80876 RepID=A0A1N7MRS6_9PROT|nr:MarR family transcriptional regulator [Insolitispirillum peregrinum]SIS88762.1 DNA-binding transcriptional regulator, MarR family [Insolitispirillum peregrinum]
MNSSITHRVTADQTEISDTQALFQLEDQTSQLLRRAHQRATALFLSDLGPGAFTPPQFAALYKLYEQGSVSQNSLGRMIAMDAATMQGVVRRLHERGMVNRTPDAIDRRRIQLSLTAEGREAVELALEGAQAVEREILAPLNSREQATFLRLLRRLA